MKCFVCDGEMKPAFVKERGTWESIYQKCESCGLTVDSSVYQMTNEKWQRTINDGHSSYQGSDYNVGDPRWVERLDRQSDMLSDLFGCGVITNKDIIVDYGCGDGKLSRKCKEKAGLEVKKYDKYMNVDNERSYLKDTELEDNMADMIITCSVWEHLIGKEDTEEVYKLMKQDGIFCLHTLVAEAIPEDPNWFYISGGDIVHCGRTRR